MSEIFASENFASQAIREISRVLMEVNFANQQYLLISRELIFAKLGFPELKSLFLCCNVSKKLLRKFENYLSWELIFWEWAKRIHHKLYIGHTCEALSTRIAKYRYDIKKGPNNSKLAEHFHDHDTWILYFVGWRLLLLLLGNWRQLT